MLASDTWLDAKSVALVGDGGNLKFTKTDYNYLQIPASVTQVHGFNNAILAVTIAITPAEPTPTVIWSPSAKDSTIANITLSISAERSKLIPLAGFFRVPNMINCRVIGENPNTGWIYGFYMCDNLIGCRVEDLNCETTTGFHGCTNLLDCHHQIDFTGGTSTGFYNSKQLTNCSSTIGSNTTTGENFESCKNLVNCIANCKASTACTCYISCSRLSNCEANINTVATTGIMLAYDTCNDLSSCLAVVVVATAMAYGFRKCSMLSNCSGGVSCTVYSGNAYIVFGNCEWMNNCRRAPGIANSYAIVGANTHVDTATVEVNGDLPDLP